MASETHCGWTSQRRKRQTEAMQRWRPWEKLTGPRTLEGKAIVAGNAFKGCKRPLLRQHIRDDRSQIRAAVAVLEAAGVETWALSPTGGELLHTIVPPDRVAVVLGAEGPGLPGELMAKCRRVSIAMSPGIDSLNVATAGAIALSHVFAARQRSRMEERDELR